LSSGNDTVDGSTALDSISGDTIVDTSGADSDTLNALVSGNINPANVVFVENVNVTGKYGSLTVDGSKYAGTKVFTFDSLLSSGTATLTSNAAGSVKAMPNISTLSVTNNSTGGTVSVDAGSATTVTVNGGGGNDTFSISMPAGASNTLSIDGGLGTDSYTVGLKGGTLDLTGTSGNETLALVGSTSAQTVNMTTALATTVTISGDQNMILSGTDQVLSGKTVTNSLASGKTLTEVVTGAAGTANFSGVGATLFDLQGTGALGSYTLPNNANVKLDTSGNTTYTAASSATTINIELGQATLGNQTSSTFSTVNLTANTANVTTTFVPIFGTNATVALAGTKNVTFAATTATAKSFDATGLSGKLTVSADIGLLGGITNITGGAGDDALTVGTFATATTVNGGLGNDTVTFGATNTGDFALTLDGGAGTNTLVFGGDANLSNGTNDKTSIISNFQKVDIGGGGTPNVVTLTQKQLLTNPTFQLMDTNTGSTLAIVDDGNSAKVFNLSGMTFGAGASPTITILGAAASANTITGSGGAESITGGSGNDTIVTGGAANALETVLAKGGADFIDLGSHGAYVDLIKETTVADSGTFVIPSTNTISTTTFDVIKNAVHSQDTVQLANTALVNTTVLTASDLSAMTALADQRVQV